jgi:hypothetical protein
MSDKIFQKNKARRKRESRKLPLRAETWLFFCEGSKTEPKYIESLVEYSNSITAKTKLKIEVKGDGRNTKSLIESVDSFLEKVDNLYADKRIKYAETFVLFDKDSFKAEDFDNAIFRARSKGYIPIWSNECFELWFILHYNLHISDNGREAYFNKLTELLGASYDKADNIFAQLRSTNGTIANAVKHAKKLDRDSSDETSPSKRVPCTQMFRFVEMLENQLSVDLKE